MTGLKIGNYCVIDKLGEGAMGKVYRALDLMVEREVAMKALKVNAAAEPETIDRFRSEAVTLARLNHPSIAQLYTFFRDGTEFYMVMEYVPGETLEQRLARTGPMPWTDAFQLTRLILEGLNHAHSQGILHRDIKPANIMLPVHGGAKLMDFGIAQMMASGPKTTREGSVVGTLEYLAPERIQGVAAGPSSDLYSMGVVLYEMLSGRIPFSAASDYELLNAHVMQPPPSLAGLGVAIPPDAEAAVMRALAKNPNARYSTAMEFSSALGALLPLAAITPAPGPAAKPAPSNRNRALVGGVAAGVALVGLALGINRMMNPPVDPWKATPPQVSDGPKPKTGDTPVIPEPDPTPIPFHPPPDVSAPRSSEPTPPPAQPAKIPAPAAPAQPDRKPVLALLDKTDGLASGLAGARPIHLAGLVAALRAATPPLLGEIRSEVARRGVNFRLTPVNAAALGAAGADKALLDTVGSRYQGPAEKEPAPMSSAPQLPTPAPAPVAPAPRVEPEHVRPITLLSDVQSIFVEKMPGELDELIVAAIDRELGARVKTLRSAAGADAVMKLQVEDKKGGTVSRAGRVFGLSDKVRTTAILIDRSGKVILWQHEVGDKKPITGAFRDKDMERVAERMVKELRRALR
ncbi:MAG: serine/threonine-protein kinase [Bryobacteraceae bacterium]